MQMVGRTRASGSKLPTGMSAIVIGGLSLLFWAVMISIILRAWASL
jgi:hypothetical protein